MESFKADSSSDANWGRKSQDDDIFEDDNKPQMSSPKVKYGKFTESNQYSRDPKSPLTNADASENILEFYGINRNVYKKADNVELPKTGTDFILLPQNPTFIKGNEQLEPVYIPKQTILEESLRREAEKICFHETLMNKIVYDCVDQSNYTKNLNPKDYGVDVLPFYIPQSKDDITLVFESRFESGNLRRAIQLYDYEYNLILKPDYFTRGHTQWYYFSVANVRKDKEYRFNIINMMKPDSLYNCGMKPLVYSETLAKYRNIGWHRDGSDICYYQNNMKKKNAGYYYTLTFSIKFKYDQDTAYIAHCYPYTYSDLCRYLKSIEDDPYRKNKLRRKPLCQTIAGNNCDHLVITNFANDIEFNKDKKGIVITSRVHPGETQASFVIEYIIDFLTGPTVESKILRDNFIFKIVPMLNPDGVINGNYRCNLAGVDLNRVWTDPNKKMHPTIFNTKLLIKKLREEREVLLYCDIHGHSRKKNMFMYGCSGKDNKRRELVFPLLYRNNCDFFSFKDTSFVIQKDRESTARVQNLFMNQSQVDLWRELSIINCYTLELSFCGPDFGKYEYLHYNYDMLREAANAFCHTIIDISDTEQSKVKQVMEEIEQNMGDKPGGIERRDEKPANNVDDQDSDYSNEGDEPKEGDPNANNNNDANLVNLQGAQGINNSQTGASTNMTQNGLSVINEVDAKGKKKTTKLPPSSAVSTSNSSVTSKKKAK